MNYFDYLRATKREDNKNNFIIYLVNIMKYSEAEAEAEANIYYKDYVYSINVYNKENVLIDTQLIRAENTNEAVIKYFEEYKPILQDGDKIEIEE